MLEHIKRLIDERDWLTALDALEEPMQNDPLNPLCLFMLGQILLETEKQPLAYMVYTMLTTMEPKRPEIWINLGKAAGELHKYEEEESHFRKALRLAKQSNNEACIFIATQNLATSAVHRTNPDQAIHWANKALSIKENRQSRVDLGFAQLAKFNFKEGWANYNAGLGMQQYRDIKQYKDEPEWDGSDGKRLVLYGEQGLGDQIVFAECVKDVRRKAKSVILHVNPKLKNLFERSFILETHAFEDHRNWVDSANIDASASLTRAQEYLRDDIDRYPGVPYLFADPLRKLQWRAALDSLSDKPKVGIAWTGGKKHSQEEARSTTLENLLPILKEDVTWVSLEYKDRSDEIKAFEKEYGIKIHDFPYATQTDDYDDTAGLVAELDLVISVPTSVVHLAGALGVPCWCITHPHPHFMFGIEGKRMPYHGSVEIFRRTKSWEPLEEIRERLNEIRSNYSSRAGTRGVTSQSGGVDSYRGIEPRSVLEYRHLGGQRH